MTTGLFNKLPPAFADFIWALPGIAGRAPVLALAHDGFSLHGALVTRQGKGMTVTHVTVSRAVSFAAALGEVVEGLNRMPGGGRSRRAVLATVSAVPALLDLPVEADIPKPARDMLGMVRWEMEPLMAEQIGLWNLGALLQGRGYLDHASRAAVAEECVRRQREAGVQGVRGSPPPVRFGETALALGRARREQVEECLALQTQLQSIDDQVLCAWAARGLAAPGESAGSGRSLWLAAGMGLTVQSRWIEACRRHGLDLEAIVPLAGTTLPLCAADGVLVEVHATHMLVARLRAGRPERLACRSLQEFPPLEVLRALLTDLLVPDDRIITLAGTHPEMAAIRDTLAVEFGRPVEPLKAESSPAGLHIPPDASPWLPALLGAVRQVLSREDALLPRLPGTEPLPPPLKRPQVWIAAGAALWLLLVAGYELSAWGRMAWMQRQVSELIGAKGKLDQETTLAREHQEKAKVLLAQAKALKQEELIARKELEFYRDELDGRGRFVTGALAALSESASSEVVVDALVETTWFELSVDAWSLSQSGAYRYARDVAAALGEWRFEARDVQVRAKPGRSGQVGYAVQFRLIRAMPGAPGENKPAEKKP